IVGLFAAGEKPTGSRGPYCLRRAAQGVMKILTDPPAEKDLQKGQTLHALVDQARATFPADAPAGEGWGSAGFGVLPHTEEYLLERRGHPLNAIRAVRRFIRASPSDALLRADALAQARKTPGFESLATLFKRVKNITKGFESTKEYGWDGLRTALTEPAERALLAELKESYPRIESALHRKQYADAMNQLAPLHAPVDKFFVDVLVMAEDPAVREARLALLKTLHDTVIQTSGDISEIAPDDTRQA